MLIRVSMVVSNGQHIGLFEKSPVCELGFVAFDHCKDRVDFMCRKKSSQSLTLIVNDLRWHIGIGALERAEEARILRIIAG